MIKVFFFITAFCFANASLYSQLPNHNMYFLANLNQHITNDTYSGCWGYVSPSGREYAILGTHLGTAFIDISDSSNIREVDFAQAPFSGSGNHWREITVYSHYAYVVTEQANSGIEIFDLQYLPDSVHLVRRFVPTGHTITHTISQSGSFIYLNGANSSFGQGTTVLDLTANPELPVKRGSLNTHYVHDARIVNDTIYAACLGNGIRIINAVNKDNLQFINSFLTPPHLTTHNCAVTKDRRFIYTTDEVGTPTPSSLKVYNIQNLSNITFVTEWRPANITTSQVHNVEIYGDTAVIAHRSAGIRVLNISNPSNPVEIAWYDTYPQNNNNGFIGCWGVYMFPSKKIIGSNKEDGLWVLKLGTLTKVNNHNEEMVDNFSLNQNYPNPFNPSTIISYHLAVFGYVKLTVYDVTGNEVVTLVNENQMAGTYEIEFNYHLNSEYGKISSGVYFYKLTIDAEGTGQSFGEVRKMLLIK